ncbi:MAG: UDP-N-acetyl-D-galactosamine dehydrogenase [bacterium]|nr:MAG: UDP-N-acetyl-D-galactosamine dehydrogenase [bacterium]
MFPVFEDFKNKKEKIAIAGLGYVGLPLAVYFGKLFDVIGFDINRRRIDELNNGNDITGEIESGELEKVNIKLTDDPARLRNARLIIATVPTPVNNHNHPDLTPLVEASATIGKNLTEGSIVVYESTVYPGVTEEICVPILEKNSGLKCGTGFKVGYSPERINPGDRKHTLPKIVKVVSGQDDETAQTLSSIYGAVVEAGVHVTPNIKTAEAAKVIENIQRDLNIALMNELALIFNKLGINTNDVLKAASTKWNFLPFKPGLVGGHCIGVDPYYLTYKAEEVGYQPQVILAGRRVNDQMGKHVAEQTVKRLIESSKLVKGCRVLILGVTFKEDVKDIRNTKVVDVYNELMEYGARPFIYDPMAKPNELKEIYGLELMPDVNSQKPYDAIVFAVRHREFMAYDLPFLRRLTSKEPVLVDVKSIFKKADAEKEGFRYWSL